VRREDYGRPVVCQICRSKFVPGRIRFLAARLRRWRPNPVYVAIVALFFLGVAIYVRYKLNKVAPVAHPPTSSVLSRPSILCRTFM
jgi:hypothetical protein